MLQQLINYDSFSYNAVSLNSLNVARRGKRWRRATKQMMLNVLSWYGDFLKCYSQSSLFQRETRVPSRTFCLLS
jgi:hypothetical protein